MKQKIVTHPKSARVYRIVFVLVALLALYVVVPQFDQFDSAFSAARTADFEYIVLAGLAIVGAVAAAASTYVWLALRPIKYRDSLLVQTAGMFVNRLLPAGIGGMGLTADFLYRHNHSAAKAGAVVALNNLITFIGHMLLLVIAVVLFDVAAKPQLTFPQVTNGLLLGIVGILLGFTGVIITKFRARMASFVIDFVRSLRLYGGRKRQVCLAFASALLNTIGHATALYLCMRAFGMELSPIVALLALTGGVAAASVTPTPGGLLGSEAGITAVLVSYKVEPGYALAIALSYRLVSYWLPLIPGAIAVWYAGKKKII